MPLPGVGRRPAVQMSITGHACQVFGKSLQKNKNRRPLQYRSTAVFLDRVSPEGQSVSDFPDSTFWPTISGVIFVFRIMSTSSEPSSRD